MNDVIVIGGGPAGAMAATFLARAGLQTLVLDADQGITRRAQVANHYGIPDPIAGPELVERGHEQARRAGATWVKAKAKGLDVRGEGFAVATEDGASHEGRQVILATGVAVDLARAAGIDTRGGTEPRIQHIVVVDAKGKTSLAGVWAAGTVAGVSVHVPITAGDGARVAIELVSELRGARHVDHDVLPSPS